MLVYRESECGRFYVDVTRSLLDGGYDLLSLRFYAQYSKRGKITVNFEVVYDREVHG